MTEAKVQCPRCSQDWLLSVRLVHLEQDAILCPECDALWLKAEAIATGPFHDYGTYLIEHGRPRPEADGELRILGQLMRTSG